MASAQEWERELVARRSRLGANSSGLPTYHVEVAVKAEFPSGAVAHFTPGFARDVASRLRARGPEYFAQADELDQAATAAEKVKVPDGC